MPPILTSTLGKCHEDLDYARQIVQAVVHGQLGVVEAASIRLPVLHRHPGIASQEDPNFVVEVASETDDLPIGSFRRNGDSTAEPEKDLENRDAKSCGARGFGRLASGFSPVCGVMSNS